VNRELNVLWNSLVTVGVILFIVGIIACILPVMREEVVVQKTVTINPSGLESITFQARGGKLEGWITSDAPVSVYLNGQNVGRLVFSLPFDDIHARYGTNTLEVFNPNLFSPATVSIFITEEYVDRPFADYMPNLMFSALAVLAVAEVVNFIRRRRLAGHVYPIPN